MTENFPHTSIFAPGLSVSALVLLLAILLVFVGLLISCFTKPTNSKLARRQVVVLFILIAVGVLGMRLPGLFSIIGFGLMVIFLLWALTRIASVILDTPNLFGIQLFEKTISKIVSEFGRLLISE